IRDTAPFTPSAISEAKSLSMTVAGRTIVFSDLAAELEDNHRREMISSQFLLNHLHSLIRLPFELLKDYCQDFDKAGNPKQSILRDERVCRFAAGAGVIFRRHSAAPSHHISNH